jgi:acyl-coenzyme A synthetase/AMP-(fatty) acid ligase
LFGAVRTWRNYNVPRQVEFITALPKSASGKVLWRVLQEEEQQRMIVGKP